MIDDHRLKQLTPFAALSKAERSMIGRLADEHSFPEGATVMSEGEYGYEFMIIEEGTVEVLRDGERIDTMGPGDFFGETAVVDVGGERNATIVATSPVRLVTLTAHYMRMVRERMPAVGDQIDHVVADRRPSAP